jgi:hypothetical protein
MSKQIWGEPAQPGCGRYRAVFAGSRLTLVAAALAMGLITFTGCTAVRRGTTETKSLVESAVGLRDSGTSSNMLEQVQSQVMREADLYATLVAEASDEFRTRVATVQARDAAQQWKLMQASAAYINATEGHPVLGAVDMVVLATLSRFVVEDYWVGERFGEAARPLLDTHRRLETNAWMTVQSILTPGQQDELRALIRQYRATYPHVRYVGAIRIQDLTGAIGKLPAEVDPGSQPGSLLGLLNINPLAGLDPTTQAIQQTRLLAQRMMYYAQRASMLLSWQAELTVFQLSAQPETRQVLSNLNEVSQSTKAFAQTAEGLTNLVNAQREAAINQVFDRLGAERTNLLAELQGEETKVRGLLNDTRQTLATGTDMAKEVNATIHSLDAFIHYVSPPDTNAQPVTPDTNSHPFNVLDYGTTAGQVGAMATNLTAMILAVNQSEAQVSRLSRQATADAKEVVAYAFRLAVVLILLIGAVVAAVVYVSRRAARSSPRANQTPAAEEATLPALNSKP